VDGQTDRQTDMMKLIATLCNFATMPKEEIVIRLSKELTKILTIRLCKRASAIVTPSQ
jgi:hypothetical protein